MSKITDARLASFDAVLSCPHEIDHDRVILKVDHLKEGNALAQLHARLSSLEASPAPVSEELVLMPRALDGVALHSLANYLGYTPEGTDELYSEIVSRAALAAKGGQ